nr:hypothetical protein Iba_scaffold50934CG0010 [Ipomoea batatas]GMD95621.1 hypothetical protein Iba_chr15aCG14080 [Ipomoea batatas]GME13149.1 hypothetical protein Iba_scaffold14362CG0020 [Ipomoea batatas]GME13167.1 hypothetical protein Iba_scaffold14363CG0080 [Ipomoea batatas]GME13168.1 hypothetical protein Iba_scaffold14363CG0090 [Ipomoea batatas]
MARRGSRRSNLAVVPGGVAEVSGNGYIASGHRGPLVSVLGLFLAWASEFGDFSLLQTV